MSIHCPLCIVGSMERPRTTPTCHGPNWPTAMRDANRPTYERVLCLTGALLRESNEGRRQIVSLIYSCENRSGKRALLMFRAELGGCDPGHTGRTADPSPVYAP